MKSRTLTLATLHEHEACKEQCDRFERHFGASVEVTPELCESVSSLFHWGWAASHLLSAPALAEYVRLRAPAWAEYARVTAPALAEYVRLRAPALAEYEPVRAPALAEYERATAPARAAYKRVMARAFAEAYIDDQGKS